MNKNEAICYMAIKAVNPYERNLYRCKWFDYLLGEPVEYVGYEWEKEKIESHVHERRTIKLESLKEKIQLKIEDRQAGDMRPRKYEEVKVHIVEGSKIGVTWKNRDGSFTALLDTKEVVYDQFIFSVEGGLSTYNHF
jgi:hypothetical protein